MILRTGQCSVDMVAIQAFEPGTFVTIVDNAERVDRDTFRLVGGDLVPLPPKPAPFMTYDADAGEWADQRTDAERASVAQGRRSATYVTKNAFLQSCMEVGLLTPREAAIAARGYIPEPFRAAIASLPPEQRDMVPVVWPATTQVGRCDPLILAIAAARGLTDDTLDALFGLT